MYVCLDTSGRICNIKYNYFEFEAYTTLQIRNNHIFRISEKIIKHYGEDTCPQDASYYLELLTHINVSIT